MKLLIKNKFISTVVGTLSAYFGVSFILPINSLSVYATSYINLKDNWVTMHYGLFINLIFMLTQTFSLSLGGYLENLFGFFKTIIIGYIITFIANLIFIFQQNIWLCYILSFFLGIGVGIATSLLGKNLILFKPDKKGLIVGILSFGIMILASFFALAGEKIINWEGYTIPKDEDFYPEYIAKRTYLYFLIGEFIIPIGLVLSLLLIYEFNPNDNKKEEDVNKENIKENEANGTKECINNNEDKNEEKHREEKEIKEEKNKEKEDNNESKKEKEKQNEDKNVLSQEKSKENIQDEEKEKENKKEKQKNILIAIKTLRFWRITLISFFINIAISFMINTGRTFGALIGINGNALQFAGIIQVFFVVLLGPPLGMLVDKKGPLLILRIIVASSILPGIILKFLMENTFAFILCFVIYFLDIVGLSVSFSPFIMEVYGIQESVILGGILNGFSKFGDVLTTISAFAFSLVCEKDKTCLKSKYGIMYLISAICCGFSTVLLFFEKKY